jgi:hypothetical protein
MAVAVSRSRCGLRKQRWEGCSKLEHDPARNAPQALLVKGLIIQYGYGWMRLVARRIGFRGPSPRILS